MTNIQLLNNMESSYTHYIPHRLEIRHVIVADGRLFVSIFLIMMAILFTTMIVYLVLGYNDQGEEYEREQQRREQEEQVRSAIVRVIENPIVELV